MKDFLSIILCLFFALQQSTMQTIVNSPKPSGGGGSTVLVQNTCVATYTASAPINWNCVVGAGTKLGIVVNVETDSSSTPVCSVAGTGMGTRVFTQADGASVTRIFQYALANPTVGTDAISCTNTGGTIYTAEAVVLTNMNQTTPHGTCATAKDGGSGSGTASVTISGAASGNVVIDAESNYHYGNGGGSNTSLTGNQTQISNQIFPGGSSLDSASQYATATGSTVMQWTLGKPSYWAIGACPYQP